MGLASKLAFYFEKRVQFKGIDLFQRRAVDVRESSAERLSAVVHGGADYQVALKYDRGTLAISCQCPYFYDNGECKHLWAAVLEADRVGALSTAASDPRLSVQEDY